MLYNTVLKWLPARVVNAFSETGVEPDGAAATEAPPDADPQKTLPDELDTLRAQSDTAALRYSHKHAAALPAALGTTYQKLAHPVKTFDFESALETLRALW